MTDIKTALSQALNEWDDYLGTNNQPEKQVENQPKEHLFKTTNNVTRATFNTVRDNPGHTRKEVLALLDDQGYKQSSTHSILSQMIKQRLVRMEDDGKLYANFKEYVPLSSTSKGKAKHVKKAKPKAAPAPAPKPEVKAAPQPQATQDKQERRIMDIEEWLSEVPLMQARLVYMRLKFIFEGESK
jgi:DNA-binding IclR family transcriptional regulator